MNNGLATNPKRFAQPASVTNSNTFARGLARHVGMAEPSGGSFNRRDATVKSRVTIGAKRDEVVFLIAPEQASESNVVYFKILHRATMLAAPTIAIQNSLP